MSFFGRKKENVSAVAGEPAKKSSERKKCLIMCRTGMGSSMMLKIQVEKICDRRGFPLDVTHDALAGYMGQEDVDVIVTMSDLTDEFKDSNAYVIGIDDIMDAATLEAELEKYFTSMNK